MTTATKKKLSASRKAKWVKINELRAQSYSLMEDSLPYYHKKPFPKEVSKPVNSNAELLKQGYQMSIHSQLLEAGFALLRLVEWDRDKANEVIQGVYLLQQATLAEDNPE